MLFLQMRENLVEHLTFNLIVKCIVSQNKIFVNTFWNFLALGGYKLGFIEEKIVKKDLGGF